MTNSSEQSHNIPPETIPDNVCYGMGVIQHLGVANMHSMQTVYQYSNKLGLRELEQWLSDNVIDEPAGAYTTLIQTFPERCENANIDFSEYEKIREEVENRTNEQQSELLLSNVDSYNSLPIELEDDVDLTVAPENLTENDIPRSVCRQMEIIRQLGPVNMMDSTGVYDTARELEFNTLAAWLERYCITQGRTTDAYMLLLNTFPDRIQDVRINFTETPFTVTEFYQALGVSDTYIFESDTGPGVLTRLENNTDSLTRVRGETLQQALDQTITDEIIPHGSDTAHLVYKDISAQLRDFTIDALAPIYQQYRSQSNSSSITVETLYNADELTDFPGVETYNPITV